ncbi:MAG: ECF transporter S component [Clostridiales bacterium]|nr:ECF transporter S component [Clostridiales bacterium]
MSIGNSKRFDTRKLVGIALLTAIVVVLQLLGSFIRFGTFSISLVLMPIVVGAALFGVWAGAWLGFVFAVVVLLQPDTAFFLGINPAGTVITVILKGVLCGACAGLVYKFLAEKINTVAGVIAAAAVAPIVNTGIFLIGCRLFFWDTIKEMAAGTKYADNVGLYLIVFFVGLNFVFELVVNLILCPAIVYLIRIGEKSIARKK